MFVFNTMSYKNPTMDALIDKARFTTGKEYEEAVKGFIDIAFEEVPPRVPISPCAAARRGDAEESSTGYRYRFHRQLDLPAEARQGLGQPSMQKIFTPRRAAKRLVPKWVGCRHCASAPALRDGPAGLLRVRVVPDRPPMLKLLLSRLATAVIPSIIGVIIVTFMLTRMLPGDPAAYFAGLAASPQAISKPLQVRTKLGLRQDTA